MRVTTCEDLHVEQVRLSVTSPDGDVTEHVLDGAVATIGRTAPTTAPDVVIDDTSGVVSRIHCILEFRVGHWWLADNDSRNGTFLLRSGERARVDEPTRLQQGDVIQLVGSADDGGERFWVFLAAISV